MGCSQTNCQMRGYTCHKCQKCQPNLLRYARDGQGGWLSREHPRVAAERQVGSGLY